MGKKIKAKGIEVETEDDIKKLLRLKTQRFIKENKLSPHFMDPYGTLVYIILETAEAEFGREGREKLEKILIPAQNARIIKELQEAQLSVKLDLLIPVKRKKAQLEFEEVDEDELD
ncbi:hypothetical protein [Archaeoglobus sp. JdFR-39]|jgi:hypothetical protein|uniref:hypothetical protein n=1 Tax=Archaeoglobus sp. JdFR-39 TaxID=1934996 RepID=UPI0025B877C6|nr:hypothetical protein [Archaeoglobus sp. JdFR-39]